MKNTILVGHALASKEYLQFIRAVLWFWHSVTDMQLTNDLISCHAWVWTGSWIEKSKSKCNQDK